MKLYTGTRQGKRFAITINQLVDGTRQNPGQPPYSYARYETNLYACDEINDVIASFSRYFDCSLKQYTPNQIRLELLRELTIELEGRLQ